MNQQHIVQKSSSHIPIEIRVLFPGNSTLHSYYSTSLILCQHFLTKNNNNISFRYDKYIGEEYFMFDIVLQK